MCILNRVELRQQEQEEQQKGK
ncbi:unnamed protein product [Chironomus riparius]|uniref:Uncharacterized protein n=1 Tax=Chironomus riparius TaxID=315576 RepID=A0A9N9WTV9_9DIPT|nr:unnamed protein product [Chironomus riparius]